MEKEKNMKVDIVKNVVIIFLVIIVLVLTFYLTFSTINVSGNVNKSEFIRNIQQLQANISYYLGSMNQNTFGVYNDLELLTGFTQNDKNEKSAITKVNGDELTPLVAIDKKVEKNGKVAYAIKQENSKKLIQQDLPDFDGIFWYIQEGKVKVDFSVEPNWWSNDFEFLLVGNN